MNMELRVTRDMSKFLINNEGLIDFYCSYPKQSIGVEAPHNWYYIINGQKIPIVVIDDGKVVEKPIEKLEVYYDSGQPFCKTDALIDKINELVNETNKLKQI